MLVIAFETFLFKKITENLFNCKTLLQINDCFKQFVASITSFMSETNCCYVDVLKNSFNRIRPLIIKSVFFLSF